MRKDDSRTKKGSSGSKNFTCQKFTKKKTHYLRTFNFDFQTFFVRWNCLICRTHFWFWSYHFSKPYPYSIGLQGTLYDPLERWETIVKHLQIRKSSLETFGLMSAFLAFMSLGIFFRSFWARCFSGQIFGFGLKWKTYLRSFTAEIHQKISNLEI